MCIISIFFIPPVRRQTATPTASHACAVFGNVHKQQVGLRGYFPQPDCL